MSNIFCLCFILLIFQRILLSTTILTSGKDNKINPDLLNNMKLNHPPENDKTWDIIVGFEAKVDIEASVSYSTLWSRLTEQATSSQQGVWEFLKTLRNSETRLAMGIKSLALTNEIFIPSATSELIHSLTTFDNVTSIRQPLLFPVENDTGVSFKNSRTSVNERTQQNPALPYNLGKIKAKIWQDRGYDGKGVIVGHIDTGAEVQHSDLNESWVGIGAGWKDPYRNTTFPYESMPNKSHGTHTLGTLVSKRVGVAPGSRWISCLGCSRGICEDWAILECGSFMLCPNPPNCSYRPRVISNGWTVPHDPDHPHAAEFFDHIIKLWRKEGIIPVFDVGSDGAKGCASLRSPADSGDVLGIGGIDESDTVTSISGRGPPSQRYPGSNSPLLIKPDLLAPSVSILSTVADGGYNVLSGTSHSVPHVAGAVALLFSRTSDLTFNDIFLILRKAPRGGIFIPEGDNASCGEQLNNIMPNHKLGFGRLQLPDESNVQEGYYLVPFDVKPPSTKMPPPPTFTGFEEERKWLEEQLRRETEDPCGTMITSASIGLTIHLYLLLLVL